MTDAKAKSAEFYLNRMFSYSYGPPRSGELAGSATAAQMPNVPCCLVNFKAEAGNAGKVYIGGAGVTKAAGTTNTTCGWELSAGDETGWLPTTDMNLFWRICDNAGDDLTYFYMATR